MSETNHNASGHFTAGNDAGKGRSKERQLFTKNQMQKMNAEGSECYFDFIYEVAKGNADRMDSLSPRDYFNFRMKAAMFLWDKMWETQEELVEEIVEKTGTEVVSKLAALGYFKKPTVSTVDTE